MPVIAVVKEARRTKNILRVIMACRYYSAGGDALSGNKRFAIFLCHIRVILMGFPFDYQ